MHGHSRQPDAIFAFDKSQLAFSEQAYPPRRYSSSSASSSDYWSYASSSSPYSSPHDSSLDYVSQERPSSHTWSDEAIGCVGLSSFPRMINSYHASLRSTEFRQRPIFKNEVDLWSTSQLPSHWTNSSLPDPTYQSWHNTAIPSIDPCETKPFIHHDRQHTVHGSFSPLSTSTISSSSPSPPPVLDGTPKLGRRPNPKGSPKICYHCHATSTPLWRREPSTLRTLCNACGLYLQQRNKLRPQELIDADAEDDRPESSDEESERTGPQCTHCRTRNTSVWRRSKSGAQLCNACGVYARLRGKDRPLSLKRKKIKPRTKHPKPTAGNQ